MFCTQRNTPGVCIVTSSGDYTAERKEKKTDHLWIRTENLKVKDSVWCVCVHECVFVWLQLLLTKQIKRKLLSALLCTWWNSYNVLLTLSLGNYSSHGPQYVSHSPTVQLLCILCDRTFVCWHFQDTNGLCLNTAAHLQRAVKRRK